MSSIVKIKGIVGANFNGVSTFDPEGLKMTLHIFVPEQNEASDQLALLKKVSKRLENKRIVPIDTNKLFLPDLPLDVYETNILAGNAISNVSFKDLEGNKLTIKDIKSGDEVAAVVNIEPYAGGSKFTVNLLRVIKLRNKVYSYSRKTKEELHDEETESERLLQEIMDNEKANTSYSDKTEL